MADPQHFEWWSEGVDAWNSRRKKRGFLPDLAGANIVPRELISQNLLRDSKDWERYPLSNANLSAADLTGADLRFADLKNADLQNAILDDARLNHADLMGANMREVTAVNADFTGATMLSARLHDAWLDGAVLDKAGLSFASMRGTRLAGARTDGTNLSHTNLAEVRSLPPELLKARLFLHFPLSQPHSFTPDPVRGVSELLGVIQEIGDVHHQHPEEVLLYFRGESQWGWDLRPAVFRAESLQASEGRMLVRLMSRRPEDLRGASSALAQWVLAQHHGLPTRFLDITSNPLVALFHACETEKDTDARLHVLAVPQSLVKPFNSDAVSVVANVAKLSNAEQGRLFPEPAVDYLRVMSRLFQLIRTEKPNFEERIDPKDFYRVFVVEPQQSSERIRAQSGAFLVSAFHQRFERDEVLKWNNGIPIYAHYQLRVSREKKEDILEELRSLDVTREKLFPGLDASAQAIADQVQASARPQQISDAQPCSRSERE